MHYAGVFLILVVLLLILVLACRARAVRRRVLLLLLVIVTRAIGVNRPYLSRNVNQQRDRAREYD